MKHILPPTVFIISLIAMCLLHFIIPFMHIILFPHNLWGILSLIFGLIFLSAATNKFTKTETTHMTFDEPNVLVTDGIYRITRNPMYLGFSLFLMGVWVLMGSITPLLVVIVFIAITDCCYIRFEEKMLLEKFGESYLIYRSKTRKWL